MCASEVRKAWEGTEGESEVFSISKSTTVALEPMESQDFQAVAQRAWSGSPFSSPSKCVFYAFIIDIDIIHKECFTFSKTQLLNDFFKSQYIMNK